MVLLIRSWRFVGRGACDACVYAYSCDLCVVVAKEYEIIRKVDARLNSSGEEAAKEIEKVEKVDARPKPRNGGAGKGN